MIANILFITCCVLTLAIGLLFSMVSELKKEQKRMKRAIGRIVRER